MNKPPTIQPERRRAPRFEVLLSGEYKTQEGQINALQVINISSSGLQFVVEQNNVSTLLPNTSNNNSMSPVSIELSLPLNFELTESNSEVNHDAHIHITCGIVYVQRRSMNHYVVGCRFEEFIDDSSERLSLYLATHQ